MSGIASALGGVDASPEDYHAHRIALGVPEGGKDYAFGDAFPHEADFDQLAGVSFTKGCFVGQEVVSRMQNRATVRKRIVPVTGEAPLTPGAEVDGRRGGDRQPSARSPARRRSPSSVSTAQPRPRPRARALTAGGVAIALRKPDWATFDLAPAIPAGAS